MNRLVKVLTSDLTPIRWVLGWLSILLSVGFLTASTDNPNYEFINTIPSKLTWVSMYFIHGVLLIITSMYAVPYYGRSLIHVFGLFLWSYVFLSFTFYDRTPIYATEWMLMIPIIVECWMLSEVKRRVK